jgi:hypothetical protein
MDAIAGQDAETRGVGPKFLSSPEIGIDHPVHDLVTFLGGQRLYCAGGNIQFFRLHLIHDSLEEMSGQDYIGIQEKQPFAVCSHCAFITPDTGHPSIYDKAPYFVCYLAGAVIGASVGDDDLKITVCLN